MTLLPSSAFVPSSTIWNQHSQLHHRFTCLTSIPRVAPLHLNNGQLDDDDDDGRNDEHDAVILTTASTLSASAFASLCTIWSEYSVLTTGCGPMELSDTLERGCYLGVLFVAGLSVFVRIVSGGQSLSDVYKNNIDNNFNPYFMLVESLSLVAVMGAFIALALQSIKGEQMDGLSGINVDMCRAIQQSKF
jgi:hypothetical protein